MSAPTRPRYVNPTPSDDRSLPDPAVEGTLDAKRVPAILGICVRSLYVGIKDGRIPSIRYGRRHVRIPTARFLEEFGFVPKQGNTDPIES